MAEDNDSSQKTEDPTQKRIEEARKKGDIAKSQDVPIWFLLVAASAIMAGAGPLAQSIGEPLARLIDHPHAFRQRHGYQHEGHTIAVGSRRRAPNNGDALDLAASGRLKPFGVGRPAFVALVAWRKTHRSASTAALQDKPSFGSGLPEWSAIRFRFTKGREFVLAHTIAPDRLRGFGLLEVGINSTRSSLVHSQDTQMMCHFTPSI